MATEKVLNTVIQLRNGTAAEWASSTLILRQAEIGIENDTGLFKIGNGRDLFRDLEYANDIKGQISASQLDIATQDDVLKLLLESGSVSMAYASESELYTDEVGKIYIL